MEIDDNPIWFLFHWNIFSICNSPAVMVLVFLLIQLLLVTGIQFIGRLISS